MNEQFIHIHTDGSKFYYKDQDLKTLHRVDGPAVEYATGIKSWWVDGVGFSESGFNAKINPSKSSCDGTTVVVDGVTYTLKKV